MTPLSFTASSANLHDWRAVRRCYRIDLVVERAIIVEIKSAETVSRLYEAQVLTYLRFSPMRLAFLMNFNVPLFKQGLKRYIR